MNCLPEPLQDTIYTYEHQLRLADVMQELLTHKIKCMFNIQYSQAFKMMYRHPDGSLRLSVTIDRIEVSASQLLKRIRDMKATYGIMESLL